MASTTSRCPPTPRPSARPSTSRASAGRRSCRRRPHRQRHRHPARGSTRGLQPTGSSCSRAPCAPAQRRGARAMERIKTVQDEMREANERLQALVKLATDEDRDFTTEETAEKDVLIGRMQALDGKRRRGESFTELLASVGKLQPPTPNGKQPGATLPAVPTLPKSLGAQFVESDIYATLRAMPRSGQWATPTVELQAAVTLNPATTLVPPGVEIVAPLFYPTDWGVADLFAQGTIDGGMVQYLQETVWTNAAAVVAMGAAKPESTKTFVLVQQGLVKIAHWIPVPDEMLDDISGLRSLIDAQLANGVVEALQNQLVNGPGTA